MKFFFITASFFLLSLNSVFAQGHEVGNGGNGVICFSDAERTMLSSVELLDFWEGREVTGTAINLGAKTLSVQDKIRIASDRVELFDPSLAKDMQTIALSMANNIDHFLTDISQYPQTQDAEPRVLPFQNCSLVQFAIQWREARTGKRRFAISRKLYLSEATDNDTRAGILLHEAMYRLALTRGARTSDEVRMLNFFVATKDFEKLELSQMVPLFESAKLTDASCKLIFDPELGISIYAKGDAFVTACSPIKMTIGDWKMEGIQVTRTPGRGVILQLKSLQHFDGVSWKKLIVDNRTHALFEEGELQALFFPAQENLIVSIVARENVIPCQLGLERNELFFGEEEKLIGCIVSDDVIYRSLTGVSLPLMANSQVTLSDGLTLQEFTPASAVTLAFSGSQTKVSVAPGVRILLDQQENLLSGKLSHPEFIRLNGQKISVNEILGRGASGGALIRVMQEIESSYLGKSVLRSDAMSGLQKAELFCQKLGFTSSLAMDDFRRFYVADPQEFYDLELDRIVTKTDEFVEILPDTVQCGGSFEIDLDQSVL